MNWDDPEGDVLLPSWDDAWGPPGDMVEVPEELLHDVPVNGGEQEKKSQDQAFISGTQVPDPPVCHAIVDLGEATPQEPEAARRMPLETESTKDPLRKRRLRGKQAAPSWMAAAPADVAAEEEEAISGVRDPSWRYFYKRFHCRLYRWWQKKIDTDGGSGFGTKRALKRMVLRKLRKPQKLKLVSQWMVEDQVDAELSSWVRQHVLEQEREKQEVSQEEGQRFIQGKAALLTYNGDWGIFPLGQLNRSDVFDRVVLDLRERPRARQLWDALEKHALEWQHRFQADNMVWSLEVCPTDWSTRGMLRLHIHVFMKFRNKMTIRKGEALSFMGTVPFRSITPAGSEVRKWAGGAAAMYYVTAPKVGSIWSGGTVLPYKDFHVAGEWVMQLVQQGKITYMAARSELVKGAKNLQRLLPDLDRWWSEMRKEDIDTRRERILRKLRPMQRPFRRIAAVQEWMKCFEEDRLRYPFLVLTGPSQTGKTQFALSLGTESTAMQLNMATAPEADLRKFDHRIHRVLVFDEISPAQVLKQKLMFQAPLNVVTLGSSNTNCYAYEVWLHSVKMVLCSNKWREQVAVLDAADQEWLASNSVVIDVTAPLWMQQEIPTTL